MCNGSKPTGTAVLCGLLRCDSVTDELEEIFEAHRVCRNM